ncbi:MAG: glycine cleavage system protein GcvH [Gemmatimonadaceae bacterium]
MANVPSDLLYTAEHEYIRNLGNGTVEVGVTDHAQGELGDIVYLELPKVGATFAQHDVFGTIEAVKAVSELFAPVAGEITEINSRLDAEPAVVNTDPYRDGWMIRLKLSDPAQLGALLTAEAYSAQIG